MIRGRASTRVDLRRSPQSLRPTKSAPAKSGAARRPPRRTQASRTKAAREKLLRATLEILQERGYSGLTTKEVASRAGFSNGALMHHFSTKADLVIAAGAHVYEQHIESGRKIAASALAKKDPLEAFISDCVDVYLGAAFIPTTEMMVAARTDPLMNAPFHDFMRHYRKIMNEIWLSAFTRADYSRQEASFLIMSTLNLVRGMAINSIWQRDLTHYKGLLREWVKLAHAGGLKSARIDVR